MLKLLKRFISSILSVILLFSLLTGTVLFAEAKSVKPDVGFNPSYYPGGTYVDTPNGRGWFSVEGVRGWALYDETVYKNANSSSGKIATLYGCDTGIRAPFTIIRETPNGKWWKVKFNQSGKYYEGWISNNYAMINLPDVAYEGSMLQNLKFEITGYTGNTTRMNGVSVPGLTGKILYTSEEEYCPLQYSTTMMLCRAMNGWFNEDGVGIKIFDAYRPNSVQDFSYRKCLAAYNMGGAAMWGITNSGLGLGWFIAPSGTSSHNVGIALDMTLYNVKTGKDYDMPTEYDELSYKALKYNSGSMYRVYEDDYGPYAWGNYTSQRICGMTPAEYMDHGMKRAGHFTCLGSEWWHFEERERSYAASRWTYYDSDGDSDYSYYYDYSTGHARNDNYGDRKSDAFMGYKSTTRNLISPENPSCGYYSCETPTVTVSREENGVNITWSNTGASKYRVYYKNKYGKWIRMATVKGTSYLDEKIKTGRKETYTVRAVTNANNAFISDFMHNGVSIIP